MKVLFIKEEEMYQAVDERHNPPIVSNQQSQNIFQAEIRTLYNRLVDLLSPFGEEGSHYGLSDFAIYPDLRQRPTFIPPPAPHVRQFSITILSKRFNDTGYLEILHKFLSTDALHYRIKIDQDFDSRWFLAAFLTHEVARVYCTSQEESSRIHDVLTRL